MMRSEPEELLYLVRPGVLAGLMRGLQKVAKVNVDEIERLVRTSNPIFDLVLASFLNDEWEAFSDGAKVEESLKGKHEASRTGCMW